jgi:Uma2 family endonuclease
VTQEEYLELEQRDEWKNEYCNGEMIAMPHVREGYVLLVGNLVYQLNQQLRPRGCLVLASRMRMQVSATSLFTYPDVIIVCGEPQFLDAEAETLLNPTVLVEVSSRESEAYDRGSKFEHYQQILCLREYLIVSSERMRAEVFTRITSNEWLLTIRSQASDSIELKSLDCRINMAELYQQIRLPPPIRS